MMNRIRKNIVIKVTSLLLVATLLSQDVLWARPDTGGDMQSSLQIPSVVSYTDTAFLAKFTAEYFFRKIDTKKYQYPLVVPLPGNKGIILYNFSRRSSDGRLPCLIRDVNFNPVAEFETCFKPDGSTEVRSIRSCAGRPISEHYHGELQYDKPKTNRLLEYINTVKGWESSPAQRIEAIREIHNMWEDAGRPALNEMLGRLDLHNHTIYSDGQMTPSYLVLANWIRGVSGMSITDHNTMDGLVEAIDASEALGMEFLPGMEIAVFDRHVIAEKFHCAVYWNGSNADFKKWLVSEKGRRWMDRVRQVNETARKKMEIVRQEYNRRFEGLEISAEDIAAVFPNGAVKRTDLARVLFKKYGRLTLGVDDIHQTKDKFLKNIRADAGDGEHVFYPDEVKEFCRENDFRLVLVHPLVRAKWNIMQVEDILRRHVFDGVEIWHSAASEAQMDKLIEMVDRLNSTISRDKPLIVTIGSDTHGKFDKRFGFNTSSRTHTGLQALEGSFRSMEILSRSARDRYIADFLLHWGMSDKSHRSLIRISEAARLVNAGVLDELHRRAYSAKRIRAAIFVLRAIISMRLIEGDAVAKAKSLIPLLRDKKAETPESGHTDIEKVFTGLTDIFIAKEPAAPAMTVVRRKSYYNDEPKLQDYFIKISLVNIDLLNLWVKLSRYRKKKIEGVIIDSTIAEIESYARKMAQVCERIEDPTHPFAHVIGNGRKTVREKFARAAELVTEKNVPAACAALFSSGLILANEMEYLARQRTKIHPGYPKKRVRSRYGRIYMRQGRRVDVDVPGPSTTSFKVYEKQPYELLSEAIGAKCKEVDSQIRELNNWKKAVEEIGTMREDLERTDADIHRYAAFIRELAKRLKKSIVPQKQIAYYAAEQTALLMESEDATPYVVDMGLGIISKFLTLRINELSEMIEATRTGKLSDARDREDELAAYCRSLIANLDAAIGGGNANEALSAMDFILRDRPKEELNRTSLQRIYRFIGISRTISGRRELEDARDIFFDMRSFFKDPNWSFMSKYIGKTAFAAKKGDIAAARETLRRAAERISQCKTSTRIVREIFDSYFDDSLFAKRMSLEEKFERTFLDYVRKAGLNKASPPERIRKAALWRIGMHQFVFVPYRTEKSHRKADLGQKKINPMHLAISYFLRNAYRDGSMTFEEALARTLKRFGPGLSARRDTLLTVKQAEDLRKLILGFDMNVLFELPQGFPAEHFILDYRNGHGWVIADRDNPTTFFTRGSDGRYDTGTAPSGGLFHSDTVSGHRLSSAPVNAEIEAYIKLDLFPALGRYLERDDDGSHFTRDMPGGLRQASGISLIKVIGLHSDIRYLFPLTGEAGAKAVSFIADIVSDSCEAERLPRDDVRRHVLLENRTINIGGDIPIAVSRHGKRLYIRIGPEATKTDFTEDIARIRMPVLEEVHRREKGKEFDLRDVSLVMYHHQTPEVAKLISTLREDGIDLFAYIGIPYNKPGDEMARLLRHVSGRRYLTLQHKKGMFSLDDKRSNPEMPGFEDLKSILDASGGMDYETSVHALARYIFMRAVEDAIARGKRLVVLEDGGKFFPVIHEIFYDLATPEAVRDYIQRGLIGVVEVTERGERIQRDVAGKFPAVTAGVSGARSPYKKTAEAYYVSDSVWSAGRQAIMQMAHRDIANTRIAVVGGKGAIGRQLVARLRRQPHIEKPFIVDPGDSFVQIPFDHASYPNVFRTFYPAEDRLKEGDDWLAMKDVRDAIASGARTIIGFTGNNSVGPEDLADFMRRPGNDEIYLISGSSSDIEFKRLKTILERASFGHDDDFNIFRGAFGEAPVNIRRYIDRKSGTSAGAVYRITLSGGRHKTIYLAGDGFPVNFYFMPEGGVSTEAIDPVIAGQYLSVVRMAALQEKPAPGAGITSSQAGLFEDGEILSAVEDQLRARTVPGRDEDRTLIAKEDTGERMVVTAEEYRAVSEAISRIVDFNRPARAHFGKSSARLLPNQEVRDMLGNECFEQLAEQFCEPNIYVIEDNAFKAAFPADKAHLANALILHVSNQRIGQTGGAKAAVFMPHGMYKAIRSLKQASPEQLFWVHLMMSSILGQTMPSNQPQSSAERLFVREIFRSRNTVLDPTGELDRQNYALEMIAQAEELMFYTGKGLNEMSTLFSIMENAQIVYADDDPATVTVSYDKGPCRIYIARSLFDKNNSKEFLSKILECAYTEAFGTEKAQERQEWLTACLSRIREKASIPNIVEMNLMERHRSETAIRGITDHPGLSTVFDIDKLAREAVLSIGRFEDSEYARDLYGALVDDINGLKSLKDRIKEQFRWNPRKTITGFKETIAILRQRRNAFEAEAAILNIPVQKRARAVEAFDALEKLLKSRVRYLEGTLDLSGQPKSFNDVIESTFNVLKCQKRSSAAIVFNLNDRSLDNVVFDPFAVRKIAAELASNEFTIKGITKIEVTARLEDDIIRLTLSDNGPGLSDDQLSAQWMGEEGLPRIFSYGVTMKEQGTGLGLFEVADTVRRCYGGDIALRNKPDGHGAVFEISLPVAGKKVVKIERKNRGWGDLYPMEDMMTAPDDQSIFVFFTVDTSPYVRGVNQKQVKARIVYERRTKSDEFRTCAMQLMNGDKDYDNGSYRFGIELMPYFEGRYRFEYSLDDGVTWHRGQESEWRSIKRHKPRHQDGPYSATGEKDNSLSPVPQKPLGLIPAAWERPVMWLQAHGAPKWAIAAFVTIAGATEEIFFRIMIMSLPACSVYVLTGSLKLTFAVVVVGALAAKYLFGNAHNNGLLAVNGYDKTIYKRQDLTGPDVAYSSRVDTLASLSFILPSLFIHNDPILTLLLLGPAFAMIFHGGHNLWRFFHGGTLALATGSSQQGACANRYAPAARITGAAVRPEDRIQPSYLISAIERKAGKTSWLARIVFSFWVVPHELGNLAQAVFTGRAADLRFSWRDLFAGLNYSGRAPPCIGGVSTNILAGIACIFSYNGLMQIYGAAHIAFAVFEIYKIASIMKSAQRRLIGHPGLSGVIPAPAALKYADTLNADELLEEVSNWADIAPTAYKKAFFFDLLTAVKAWHASGLWQGDAFWPMDWDFDEAMETNGFYSSQFFENFIQRYLVRRNEDGGLGLLSIGYLKEKKYWPAAQENIRELIDQLLNDYYTQEISSFRRLNAAKIMLWDAGPKKAALKLLQWSISGLAETCLGFITIIAIFGLNFLHLAFVFKYLEEWFLPYAPEVFVSHPLSTVGLSPVLLVLYFLLDRVSDIIGEKAKLLIAPYFKRHLRRYVVGLDRKGREQRKAEVELWAARIAAGARQPQGEEMFAALVRMLQSMPEDEMWFSRALRAAEYVSLKRTGDIQLVVLTALSEIEDSNPGFINGPYWKGLIERCPAIDELKPLILMQSKDEFVRERAQRKAMESVAGSAATASEIGLTSKFVARRERQRLEDLISTDRAFFRDMLEDLSQLSSGLDMTARSRIVLSMVGRAMALNSCGSDERANPARSKAALSVKEALAVFLKKVRDKPEISGLAREQVDDILHELTGITEPAPVQPAKPSSIDVSPVPPAAALPEAFGAAMSAADTFWPYLGDLLSEEAVAKDLFAATASACLKKKIVFAFDSGGAGVYSSKAIAVMRVLEELKKDDRYKGLLENNLIVLSSVPKNLVSRIQPYLDEGAVVFTFARSEERERLAPIESRVNASYVDMPKGFPGEAYVPLPEIVAMALGKYLGICDPIKILNEVLKEINIGKIDPQDLALVFHLSRKPLRIDTETESVKRYTLLKQFLAAA